MDQTRPTWIQLSTKIFYQKEIIDKIEHPAKHLVRRGVFGLSQTLTVSRPSGLDKYLQS